MRILTEYGSRIVSADLNKKIEVLVGKSCIVSGFAVTGEDTSSIKIEGGTAIVNGAILIEDEVQTIISVPEDMRDEEKLYIRMEYRHQLKQVLFNIVSSEDDGSATFKKEDGYLILAEITTNEDDRNVIDKIEQNKEQSPFLPIISAIEKIKSVEDNLDRVEGSIIAQIDSIKDDIPRQLNVTKDDISKNINDMKNTVAADIQKTKQEIDNKINETKQTVESLKTSIKWEDIVGKPSSMPASDVYAWAKAASKPGYGWNEITGKPSSMPASDVYAWAKAASKPGYTAAEVGAIPTSASCNKNWYWSGQAGQPSWLWGGNDGTNMYVYDPSNFNVDMRDSLHAWQMETLSQAGTPHGTDHYMFSKYNVHSDNRFYVGISTGFETKADYATKVGAVGGRDLAADVTELQTIAKAFKGDVAAAINGLLGTSLNSDTSEADLVYYIVNNLKKKGSGSTSSNMTYYMSDFSNNLGSNNTGSRSIYDVIFCVIYIGGQDPLVTVRSSFSSYYVEVNKNTNNYTFGSFSSGRREFWNSCDVYIFCPEPATVSVSKEYEEDGFAHMRAVLTGSYS